MDEKGYADLGYHFVIGPDGTIYEGRDLRIRGAHVDPQGDAQRGYTFGNTGTVGIALIGEFNGASPTAKQMEALKKLIASLRDSFDIRCMTHHRDVNPTDCPGDMCVPLLPPLARELGMTYGNVCYEPSQK